MPPRPLAPSNSAEGLDEQIRDIASAIITDERQRIGRKLWLFVGTNVCLAIMLIVMVLLIFTRLGDCVGFRQDWVTGIYVDADGAGVTQRVSNPDAVLASTRNMITVLSPVFLGLVIWMVTIVAERRLKAYDQTIDDLRDHVDEKLDKFRENLGTARKEIPEEVEDRVSKNISNEVGTAIAIQKEDFAKAVAEYREDLESATENVRLTQQQVEDRFGHIADTTTYARDESGFGPITSVGAVHTKVSQLFFEKKRSEAIILVKQMLDQFHLRHGTHRPAGSLRGDWFNLSAELGRNDEEGLALEVCLAGLEQQNGAPIFDEAGRVNWKQETSPPDTDVIAHAMQYAKTINDGRLPGLLEVNGYDSKAKRGQPTWGWRSYAFTIQALESLGRRDEAIELGMTFMREVKVDGDSSKVIQDLGSVMADSGQKPEAIKLMMKWLKKNPYAPAAQVITQLLVWLDGDPDTDMLISLATRGIRDLAEEQASASLSNLYYRRALARDKRVLNAVAENQADIDVCSEIQKALNDYSMARETGALTSLGQQIEHREKVLRRLADEQGCDLGDLMEEPPVDDSGPGEMNSIGRVQEVVAAVFPILTDDEMSNGEKAEKIQKRLAEEDHAIRTVALQFLTGLQDDDDVPEQLRSTLSAVLPLVKMD